MYRGYKHTSGSFVLRISDEIQCNSVAYIETILNREEENEICFTDRSIKYGRAWIPEGGHADLQ